MIPVTITWHSSPPFSRECRLTTMLPELPRAGDSIHFAELVDLTDDADTQDLDSSWLSRGMDVQHVRWMFDRETALWTTEILVG
jgi:hypothetical protein